MMIIMRTDASQKEVEAVIERVKANGLNAHISKGEERTVIGAVGDGRTVYRDQFLLLAGVDRVVPISAAVQVGLRVSSAPRIRSFRWMASRSAGQVS